MSMSHFQCQDKAEFVKTQVRQVRVELAECSAGLRPSVMSHMAASRGSNVKGSLIIMVSLLEFSLMAVTFDLHSLCWAALSPQIS